MKTLVKWRIVRHFIWVFTLINHLGVSSLQSVKQEEHAASRNDAMKVVIISNSYAMACPPVRGDNPRALASGLSYVQADKHVITILYHLRQYRPRTSWAISC